MFPNSTKVEALAIVKKTAFSNDKEECFPVTSGIQRRFSCSVVMRVAHFLSLYVSAFLDGYPVHYSVWDNRAHHMAVHKGWYEGTNVYFHCLIQNSQNVLHSVRWEILTILTTCFKHKSHQPVVQRRWRFNKNVSNLCFQRRIMGC